MHAMTPTHWLILLITVTLFAVPSAVILKRAGYPAVWILLAIVPGVAIVGLWLFAFAKWPVLARHADV